MFAELKSQIEKIKLDIEERIMGLPDNPDIERVNNNCFVISASKCQTNWQPEFYDYKRLYRLVVEEIVKRLDNPTNCEKFLRGMLSSGKFKQDAHTIYIPEKVLGYLRSTIKF